VADESKASNDGFAAYFAKRLMGDKRFQMGVPEEAAELGKSGDIALFKSDLSLLMSCIVDSETDRSKKFALSRQRLIEIGKACLKYTGTVNGAKMPVSITIYEVGSGPLGNEDRARLTALQKNFALDHVALTAFYIDTQSKSVFCPGPFNGLLRGRRWIARVLREPRKNDPEVLVADAALPAQNKPPVVTIGILVVLIAMFVVEQLAKLSGKGPGLLGVDVGTLFALGGMSSDAVSKDGEWYRLFTAALLHADAIHLLLNGVALGLAGFLLESLVGRTWLIALFLLGAAGGSLMGLFVNPANLVSVGASGAVMGLLAAALILAMRFPPGLLRTQTQMRLLQFLIPSLIPLATYRHSGHIDYAAHFGGAIVGLASGYALFAIWPRNEQTPRFPWLGKSLATLAILVFCLSLVFAKSHYAAHAAEAAEVPIDELLVDDARMPKDWEAKIRDVETWGKGYPRDPRVHLFRAFRLLDEHNPEGAKAELRAALDERQILGSAFPNGKLEVQIRSVLCDILVLQDKRDDALLIAAPVCKAENGVAPKRLKELGVCD
jgi:rhomboid protease GluP